MQNGCWRPGEGSSLDIASPAQDQHARPHPVRYPRRRVLRFVLRLLGGAAFAVLGRLKIEGHENLPKDGPFVMVANHFHFADPVALLWLSRRQVEFIGGRVFVFAPKTVRLLPYLWGYMQAFRGGYSRNTLRASLGVLEQGGIVALFPEGGTWAQVLRPPRPGAAFLAVESGVPVVPVGLDGFTGLFRQWRPQLTVRIGAPIGPFAVSAGGAERRSEIDGVSETIMHAIAELIPPERHGVYSDDEALRRDGEKVAAFPFHADRMRGM